jgi:predicted 3-demethylubiquinone-9 3-methyltransferase (glyoxalase superfamily)
MSALAEFPRITPFLWFEDNAEEAVNFYLSVFKNSRRLEVQRNTGGAPGPSDILTIAFELDGQKFTALNGGPLFKFTEALSFVVRCDSQEEVDDIGQSYRPEAATDNVGGSRISLAFPGRLCLPACRT